MLGRVTLATVLIVATAFTGCIGAKDDDQPVQSVDNAPDNLLNETEAQAPDGRTIAAFNETNKTEGSGIGAMVHEHDYWKGSERLDDVAWINSGLIPFPLTPCKKEGNGCSVGSTTPNTDTYPAGTAIADYDLAPPPEMGMIYEGTKQVEVTLKEISGVFDDTPANPAGKVYFDYLAANDEAGKFRPGGELVLGTPFVIDIEPTMADMPHQTKSLWIFRIYSNSEMVTFGFNITISLVKGYDVVNWPPHPDLYADSPTRTVFEDSVTLQSKGSVDGVLFGSDAGWSAPQKVISWGTDKVDVTISNVKFTGDTPITPAPSGYVLQYRNASKPFLMANGNAFGDKLEDPTSDGTNFHFTIDLTEDRGDAYDTPYAAYSRWGFRLYPYFADGGNPVTGGTCIDEGIYDGFLWGCQWYGWTLTYDMKIVATGHSIAQGETKAVG